MLSYVVIFPGFARTQEAYVLALLSGLHPHRRLLKGFGDNMHGVMTFLAGLELTRSGVLFLRQSEPFSELWLYRREEDEDGVSSDVGVIEVDS